MKNNSEIVKLLILIILLMSGDYLYSQQIVSLSIEESGNLYSSDTLKVQYVTNPSDGVKLIYDWQVSNDGGNNFSSIKVLDLPFDGNTLAGESKSKNYVGGSDGINSNTTYENTAGRSGRGAMRFSGSNSSYITLGSGSEFVLNESTVSIWFYWEPNGDRNYGLISKDADGGNAGDLSIRLYRSTTGAPYYAEVLGNDQGNTFRKVQSNETLSANQWNHLVCVFTGAEVYMYLNGVKQANSLSATMGFLNSSIDLRVGIRNTDEAFRGLIDNVRIYKRALSKHQISALYNEKYDFIVPYETKAGEVWKLTATPNDNSSDGTPVNSNNEVTIQPPSISGVQLDYLTDGAIKKNVLEAKTSGETPVGINVMYDWKIGGSSIKALDMPFNNGEFIHKDSVRDNISEYNGKINNIDYVPDGGHDGSGCFVFNDSLSATDANADDYITIPKEVGAVFGGDFTWAIWFNHNHKKGVPFANRNSKFSDDPAKIFAGMVTLDVDGTIVFKTQGSGDPVKSVKYSNALYKIGAWNHIAVTKKNNVFYVYLNGIPLNELRDTVNGSTAINEDLILGKNMISGVDYSPIYGKLDDFVIYKRALTSDQVKLLYSGKKNILHQSETKVGEIWSVTTIPNDNFSDGVGATSNNVNVALQPVDKLTINNGGATSFSGDTLVANISGFIPSDASVIYDWKVDPDGDETTYTEQSIKALDMPMAGGTIGAGGTIKDYIGGYNGTPVNVDYISDGGRDGTGVFKFDDASMGDYIKLPASLGSVFTGDFTWAIWFNHNNPADAGTPFSIRDYSNTGVRLGAISLREDNRIRLEVKSSGVASVRTMSTDPVYTPGEWGYIVVTRKGDEFNAYFNGELIPELKITYSVPSTITTDGLCLGRYNAEGIYYDPIIGMLDDFTIYKRALTPGQIKLLYQNGAGYIFPSETNLNEKWNVCVTTNNNVADGTVTCSENSVTIIRPEIDDVNIMISSIDSLPSDTLTSQLTGAHVSEVKVFYDWKLNDESIKPLHLSFDRSSTSASNLTTSDVLDRTTATVSNAIFIENGGKDGGGAFSFSEVIQSKIEVPASSQLNNLNEISVIARIKLDNSIGNEFRPIAAQRGSEAGPINWQFYIQQKKLMLALDTINGDANSFILKYSDGEVPTGRYIDVAVTYDGRIIKFYLDGVSVGTRTTIANYLHKNSIPTYIGTESESNWFKGYIDDFRIYNRALSPEQMKLFHSNPGTIHPEETSSTERWKLCVKPHDNYVYGDSVCSGEIKIKPPKLGDIVINDSEPISYIDENLIANHVNLRSESSKLIYDWKVSTDNGSNFNSIKVIDIPFDGGLNSSGKVKEYINSYDVTMAGAPQYLENGGVDGNGAYRLTGGNLEGFSIPDNPELSVTSDFSIMVWVKADLNQSNNRIIINKGAGSGADQSTPYSVSFTPSNQFLFLISNGSAVKYLYSNVITDNNWHFVVAQLNNGKMEFIIDGVSDTQLNVGTSHFPYDGNDSFRIGYLSSSGVDNTFNGLIDEVKVLKRPLSHEQILQVYNSYIDNDPDTRPFSIISSKETKLEEVWSICATPIDNLSFGDKVCNSAGDKIKNIELSGLSLISNPGNLYRSTDTIVSSITNVLPTDADIRYNWYKNGEVYHKNFNDYIYSASSSELADIATDTLGNFYLFVNKSNNYLTIKYNSDGEIVWFDEFNTGGTDKPKSISVTPDGSSVCLSGGYNWSGRDYFKMFCYDSDGVRTVNVRYIGGIDSFAFGNFIDSDGNLYVTGYNKIDASNVNLVVIKYDKSTGNEEWVLEDRPISIGCHGRAVHVDDSGNIIVGGVYSTGSNYSYLVAKYDKNRSLIWYKTYDNSGTNDFINDLTVDKHGNIYCTGSDNGESDYYTIKYSSDGEELWTRRFDSGGIDKANGIDVDKNGNVLVVGESQGNSHIIKYDKDGNELWSKTYDGGGVDKGKSIIVGDDGDTYVGGSTTLSGSLKSHVQHFYEHNESILLPEHTTEGQKWKVKAVPYYRKFVGLGDESSEITITAPEPLEVSLTISSVDTLSSDTLFSSTNYDKLGYMKQICDWKVDENDGNGFNSIKLLNIPFDGGFIDGSKVKDYINGYNGSIVADVEYIEDGGVDGRGALDFNNGYLTLNTSELDFTNEDFTFSFWVKNSSLSLQYIYMNRLQTIESPSTYGYYISTINNKIEGGFYNGTSTRIESSVLSLNQWYHVAVVKENTTYRLYVNGNKEDEKTGNHIIIHSSSYSRRYIGANLVGNYRFYGMLDEFEVYKRALSSEQIKFIAGNPGNQSVFLPHETNVGEEWKVNTYANDNSTIIVNDESSKVKINSTRISDIQLEVNSLDTLSSDSLEIRLSGIVPSSSDIIYDWKVNNVSIKPLELLFESKDGINDMDRVKDVFNRDTAIVYGAEFTDVGGVNGSGAFYFDGVNDSLVIDESSLLNSLDEITISASIKVDETLGAGYHAIAAQRSSCSAEYINWQLYLDGTKLMFALNKINGDPGSYVLFHSDKFVTKGVYTDVSVTYDGRKICFYIDGVPSGTHITPSDYLHKNSLKTFIGVESCSNFYKGFIDNFRIYNRALSHKQIIQEISGSTKIHSEELASGDIWKVCAKPAAKIYYGETICSNEILIKSPVVETVGVEISSTDTVSSDTLKAICAGIKPNNSDVVYNWMMNNEPVAALKMSFNSEKNPLKDFSNNDIGDAAGNEFGMQLREHKHSGYSPNISFSKPSSNTLSISASTGPIGLGCAFAVFKKELINGKKLYWDWSGSTNRPPGNGNYYSAYILDGRYNAASSTDFPYGAAIANKGNGLLFYIDIKSGSFSRQSGELTLDLTSSVEEYVTVIFSVNDGWDYNYGTLNIYDVKILDNEVPILTANMSSDINMVKTGGYDDYGYMGEIKNLGIPEWNSDLGFEQSGAFYFNGTDNYINKGSSSKLALTTFSISARIKTDVIDGTILCRTEGGNSSKENYNLSVDNSGKLNFSIGDGTLSDNVSSSTIVNDGNWHFVVATYDGNVAKLYIDGVFDVQKEFGLSPLISGNQNFIIGSSDNSENEWIIVDKPFKGVVDDIIVYNRQLSLEQIQQNFISNNIVLPEETNSGEIWSVCATPYDNSYYGDIVCSETIKINKPRINQISINNNAASANNNDTLEVDVSGVHPSDAKIIYDWQFEYNGSGFKSIKVFDMPFDGNIKSGGMVKEYIGNIHGNLIDSPEYIDSYEGRKGVYRFNQTNNISTNSRSWGFTTTATYSVWINTTDADGGCIMSIGRGDYLDELFLHLNNDGTVIFYNQPKSGTARWHKSTETIHDGNWHNITAVIKGEECSDMAIYIDGVKSVSNCDQTADFTTVGSVSDANPRILRTGQRVYSSPDSPNTSIDGYIDDVRVYNRPLSEEQIKAIYFNNGVEKIIVSKETKTDEFWKVCAIPNDNTEDGDKKCVDSAIKIISDKQRRVLIVITDL